MTVAELIAQLSELDPAATVVIIDDWQLEAVGGVTGTTVEEQVFGEPGGVTLRDGFAPSGPLALIW